MMHSARVIGIDDKLTVRTRGEPTHVDLWCELSFDSMAPQWPELFNESATQAANELTVKRLEYFSFTQSRGWIVARGVERNGIVPADIEAKIRGIVARVNEQVVQAHSAIVAKLPKKRVNWSARVLGGLLSIFALLAAVYIGIR
jgi:hypothetical protein